MKKKTIFYRKWNGNILKFSFDLFYVSLSIMTFVFSILLLFFFNNDKIFITTPILGSYMYLNAMQIIANIFYTVYTYFK